MTRRQLNRDPRGVLWTLLAVSLLAASQTFGADPPPGDPLEWKKPSAQPEFRNLIQGPEFQRRFQNAWKELGELKDLEKSDAPAVAARIVNVAPGGYADRLRIQAGDLMTHCNGEELWTIEQLPDDENESRNVRIRDSAGQVRELPLPSGRLGIDAFPLWNPHLLYLRQGKRNSIWDREIVVAMALRDTDPDLAETCWALAVRSGYPTDLWSAMIGAIIAANQGRNEVACDFASFCLEPDRGPHDAVHPLALFHIAMANFKLKHALEIVKRSPTKFDQTTPLLIQSLLDVHESRPADQRTVAAPSILAARMYQDDLRERVVALDSDPENGERVSKIKGPTPFTIAAKTAHFHPVGFSAPRSAKNIDFQIRFRMHETDDAKSEFLKVFECGILDVEHDQFAERHFRSGQFLLHAMLTNFGSVMASTGQMTVSQFDKAIVELPGETELTLRLIRVDGQGELYFNGRRVLYVPVYDDVDFVAMMLKSVGMTIEVLDISAVELIEQI